MHLIQLCHIKICTVCYSISENVYAELFDYLSDEAIAMPSDEDCNAQFMRKWAKKFNLTPKTLEILKNEEVTCEQSLASLSRQDIDSFHLTIGQRNLVTVGVLALQASSSATASSNTSRAVSPKPIATNFPLIHERRNQALDVLKDSLPSEYLHSLSSENLHMYTDPKRPRHAAGLWTRGAKNW